MFFLTNYITYCSANNFQTVGVENCEVKNALKEATIGCPTFKGF